MDFKLVSKQNLGVAASLILVVLFSQAKIFNFLIDTVLGRSLIILFILGISYTNKILGVVTVLLLIVIINQSNIGYIEGFDTKSDASLESIKLKEQDLNVMRQQLDRKLTQETKEEKETTEEEKEDKKTTSIEGFNITDKEDTILRGKQSNQVPVFSSFHSNPLDNVEPSDKSVFTTLYSSFL